MKRVKVQYPASNEYDWARGLWYNTGVNHMKSGQVLLAPTHPFSTCERGARTMTHSIPNSTEQSNIPYGYCHCGCGRKTTIAKVTDPRRGNVKGQPVRFVTGHGGVLVRAAANTLNVPEGARAIPLTRGKFAIVDDADFDRLSRHLWCAVLRKRTWYAARHEAINGKSVGIYMHRVVANAPEGIKVDHKDGDGLNNRRGNLRAATVQQNNHNQRPYRNARSQYKGVTWCTLTEKWRARIRFNGKYIHIGRYDQEADAALAYDQKARQLFGEFAWVNLP